jgi:hypothetical protein
VRFQTSETVAVRDPEMVLRALEICLRNVSSEVERYGHQITMHGLGPSPRTMNRHDTTVLCVNAEDDRTIISADVNFQASALLGDMPQDAVVRSKLEQVFDEMKMQLDLDAKRASAHSSSFDAAAIITLVEVPPSVEPEACENSLLDDYLTEQTAGVSPLIADSPVSIAHNIPASVDADDGILTDLPSTHKPEQESANSEEPASRKSSGAVLASVLLAFILVIAGVFSLRLWHGNVHLLSASPHSQQPVTVKESQSAENGKTAEKDAMKPPPAVPDGSDVQDPASWLQEWAAAIRSRDPVNQASFYANPVQNYLGQSNVSKDRLIEAKQAAIQNRKGLWTVRIDNMVVEKQAGSEATIRLVKHIMSQVLPHEISERSVTSRLRLKQLDGRWKIVSEQDLPPTEAHRHAPDPTQ